jgi:hypothetical protein
MREVDFLIPHSSCLIVVHGQGEIRTHDTGYRIPVFETGAFSLSATCPDSLQISPRPESESTRPRSLRLCPQSTKKVLQQLCALRRQHSTHDLGSMIQTRVPNNVGHRTRHPRLLVERTKHEHAHPRQHDRSGAHRARLEGHVQRAVVEPP